MPAVFLTVGFFKIFVHFRTPTIFSLEIKHRKPVKISRENIWGFKGFRTFSPRQIQNHNRQQTKSRPDDDAVKQGSEANKTINNRLRT